jgi:hypothetical protein
MTRTEILKIRLDELDKERTNIQVRAKRLYIRRQKELINVLSDWFIPFNIEDKDVSFKFTEYRVEVLRKQKEEDKVIFWFKLREEWDGKTTFTGFELNRYYDGFIVNEDIVTEMILTAKWSQFVLDYQDDIVAELNMVQERYDKFIEAIGKKEGELRKAINQQQSDIDELEKENNLAKLTTVGIELDTNKRKNKDSYLPSIELKYNWTMHYIKALKVLRMTASKKSADIEIKKRDWNGDIHTIKVEKVRMDNILHFVNYNKEIIV